MSGSDVEHNAPHGAPHGAPDSTPRDGASGSTGSRRWTPRRWLIFLVDGVLCWLALWAAVHLRFLDSPTAEGSDVLASYFADSRFLALGTVLMLSRWMANFHFNLHRWSFKFSGLRDGARVAAAVVAGSGLFVLAAFFGLRSFGFDVPARGIVVIELMLSLALLASYRFLPRLLWMYRADLFGRREGARTLIVGAGDAGELLLRKLQREPELKIHAVGFVDDDRTKRGHIVGGIPVLGAVNELTRWAADLRISQVVIAIPTLDGVRLRRILSSSFAEPVQFKILPPTFASVADRSLEETLQDISTEDLLARAELVFQYDESFPELDLDPERSLLVAGAAGSIGSEVTLQLLRMGARRVVMLDTDENGLYMLHRRFRRQFPDSETLVEVADIRETERLRAVFARHRPKDVFHAAARKHVPLMEAAPTEAVKTNVIGTLNLAQVAEEQGTERFVFMSTDKAVRPSNVMGATKRLGELVLQFLSQSSRMRFSVVRFGNVLDSAGSVVPLFREQIAKGGPVTVTHPDVQRYFMTISEAVGLVLRAAYGDYGRLCVLEMGQPLKIVDLARQMITMAGLVPDVDIAIRYIGLRPGEKIHEELLYDDEVVVDRIDKKIQVVEGPAVPDDLMGQVQQLRVAALSEDEATVRDLLSTLLPDYAGLQGARAVERSLPLDVM